MDDNDSDNGDESPNPQVLWNAKYLLCKYVQGGEEYHVDAGSPIALTCVIGLEDIIIQSLDEYRSWVQEESKSSSESFIDLQFFKTLFKKNF